MRNRLTGMSSLLLCVCAVALLSGCALDCTQQPIHVVDTACDWIPALSASASDTAETKREVIAYESARQKNCGIRHDEHGTTAKGAN